MDTKLFARIGAGAFVATALTLSVLGLHEDRTEPLPEIITVSEADGDPLTAQLRACETMGERALSSLECRAAWAEKRRRFLGVDNGGGEPVGDVLSDVSAAPNASSGPQSAKGQ